MANNPYDRHAKTLAQRLLKNPNDKETKAVLEGLVSQSGVSAKGLLSGSSSLDTITKEIMAAKAAADRLTSTVGTYQRLGASQIAQLKATVREAESGASVYRKYSGPIPKYLSDTLKAAGFGSRNARRTLAETGYGPQLSLFGRGTAAPTVRIQKKELESISGPLEEMAKRLKESNSRQLKLPFYEGAAEEDKKTGRPPRRGRGGRLRGGAWDYFYNRMARHYPYTLGGLRYARGFGRGLGGMGAGEAAEGAAAGGDILGAYMAAGSTAPLLIGAGAYETQHLMLKGVGKYLGAIGPLRSYTGHLGALGRYGGVNAARFRGFGGGSYLRGLSQTVMEAGNVQLNAAIAASMGLPYSNRGNLAHDVGAIQLAHASKYMGGLSYGAYEEVARQGRTLGLFQSGHLRTYMERYYLPTIAKGVKEGVQSAQTRQSMTAGIQALASRGLSVNPQFVSNIISQMQASGISGLRTIGAQQRTIAGVAQAGMHPTQNAFRFLAMQQRLRSIGVRPGLSAASYKRLLGANSQQAQQLAQAKDWYSLSTIAGGYGLLSNQTLPAISQMARHITGGNQAIAAQIIARQTGVPMSEALQWALPQKQRLTNQVQQTLANMGSPAMHTLTATYNKTQKNIEKQHATYQNLLLGQSSIVYQALSGFADSLEKAATAVQHFTKAYTKGGVGGMYKHTVPAWTPPLADPSTPGLSTMFPHKQNSSG